jgi:hypothetical protein
MSSSCKWEDFERTLVSFEGKGAIGPDDADRLYSLLDSVMKLSESEGEFQRYDRDCLNTIAAAVRKLQSVPRLHIKGFILLHTLMTKRTLAVARDAATQERDQHSYSKGQVIIFPTSYTWFPATSDAWYLSEAL